MIKKLWNVYYFHPKRNVWIFRKSHYSRIAAEIHCDCLGGLDYELSTKIVEKEEDIYD